jgi:hypothetical protein
MSTIARGLISYTQASGSNTFAHLAATHLHRRGVSKVLASNTSSISLQTLDSQNTANHRNASNSKSSSEFTQAPISAKCRVRDETRRHPGPPGQRASIPTTSSALFCARACMHTSAICARSGQCFEPRNRFPYCSLCVVRSVPYRLQHAGALGDAEGAQPFNIRQQTSSDKYLVEECSRAVLLYFPLHARLLHTNILDLIFSRCLEVVAFKRCGILIPLYHTQCASLPSYPFC